MGRAYNLHIICLLYGSSPYNSRIGAIKECLRIKHSWAAGAKSRKSMKDQKITMPKKTRKLRFVIPALSFLIFSVIFCYGSLLYWKVGFSLNRMVSYLYYDWENIKINPSEIPVYPNAKIVSITYNESAEANGIVNIWKFTTNDTPDTVWKYYVDEMNRRWGFFEHPMTEFPLHLVVISCPTYGLVMTSSTIDNITYQVTIQFISRPCF